MTRSGFEIQNSISFSGMEDKPIFFLIILGVILFPFLLKHMIQGAIAMDKQFEEIEKSIEERNKRLSEYFEKNPKNNNNREK
jgi:hypothetical protein